MSPYHPSPEALSYMTECYRPDVYPTTFSKSIIDTTPHYTSTRSARFIVAGLDLLLSGTSHIRGPPL